MAKRRLRARDIERLENTSIAAALGGAGDFPLAETEEDPTLGCTDVNDSCVGCTWGCPPQH